jgi:hypothetical protein
MAHPSGITPAISIRPSDSLFPQHQDLSTTPGGTIYATTPGGTRIVYDRNALLFLRNSPMSKTPPNHIAFIPGVTAPPGATPPGKDVKPVATRPKDKPDERDDDGVFPMD